MPTMVNFPSIRQFRDIVSRVVSNARFGGYDGVGNAIVNHAAPLPTLEFEGTVKLHGTNAAIARHSGDQWYQSRERLITPGSDNAAFAAHMSVVPGDAMDKLFDSIERTVPTTGEHPVVVFGEWCGSGIQRGTAISDLPKMFVVFRVKVNDEWLTRDQIEGLDYPRDHRVLCIYDFPTYRISIDFGNPQLQQNELGSRTLDVEAECPVAKHFGISGVGEGIVWSCVDPDPKWNSSQYWFKVKGEKHSSSKVKTLAAVDIERLQSKAALIDLLVTENRLQQAIQVLKERGVELSQKTTGDFVRWVFNDCVKEELDTIMGNGFEPKELGTSISQKARSWYFTFLDSQV